MNEELPEKKTSTPRTREASAVFLLGNRQAVSNQLKEDADGVVEESDPPIVVRDGRADYTRRTGEVVRARRRSGQRNIATIALTPGKECSHYRVSSYLVATGDGSDTLYPTLAHGARFSEEPGAGKPHAGICEGGTG